MNKKLAYSLFCFSVALFLFLFGSVDRIRLVGEAPGELPNDQKALEIAKGRGFWPAVVNFDTAQHIDVSQEARGWYMIRYVGVAYLGNILIMVLFLISGILIHMTSSESVS